MGRSTYKRCDNTEVLLDDQHDQLNDSNSEITDNEGQTLASQDEQEFKMLFESIQGTKQLTGEGLQFMNDMGFIWDDDLVLEVGQLPSQSSEESPALPMESLPFPECHECDSPKRKRVDDSADIIETSKLSKLPGQHGSFGGLRHNHECVISKRNGDRDGDGNDDSAEIIETSKVSMLPDQHGSLSELRHSHKCDLPKRKRDDDSVDIIETSKLSKLLDQHGSFSGSRHSHECVISKRKGDDDSAEIIETSKLSMLPDQHEILSELRHSHECDCPKRKRDDDSADIIETSNLSMIPDQHEKRSELRHDFIPECSWDFNFSLLQCYKKREGNCEVPPSYIATGDHKLGEWLDAQKQMKRKGDLNAKHEKLLEELGVLWYTSPDDHWESMFQLLAQYRKREGHCNIPEDRVEKGCFIGEWLSRQKAKYNAGKLDGQQEKRLALLGVSWPDVSGPVPNDVRWKRAFSLLKQYKEREGHCRVRPSIMENGLDIGNWLSFQKHKRSIGNLSKEREELLEKLGVAWKVSVDDRWESMFKLLVKFKESEGHCNVPTAKTEKGCRLGKWLSKQRQMYRNGTLNLERRQRMEHLGVSWSVSVEDRWERAFSLLKCYKEKMGHLVFVGEANENGLNLGTWLHCQKQKKKKGKLDLKKQKRLERLGVCFR